MLSRKSPHSFGGRTINVGQVGVLSFRGRPIIVHKPGNYWNFSLTHAWSGRNLDLTEVNQVNGLTFAQVGQSEAMVCLDPTNQVFVVRNSGFVGYGASGNYKVIDVVDTLNLGEQHAVREADADIDGVRRILGYKKEVKHTVYVKNVSKEVTIATFFIVPAANVLVIQNGGLLKALGAGQHVITNPRCTFRGFFSLGEKQTTFQTQPAYTLEGVAVRLHLNLRYRVVDAIELTKSYESPFQALKNPAQSAVNAVVSRLSYQQFMRAKKIAGDVGDIETMSWLEAFKSECLKDLASHALEYGVLVLSFDVLDRKLEGKLGEDLEKQAETVLKNQMQSTQVALQNRIATETEEGKLEVAKVKALQVSTEAEAAYLKTAREADATYYQTIKQAEARAETLVRVAQAEADSNKIAVAQEVLAIQALAHANSKRVEFEGQGYASVTSDHARRVQLEQIEAKKFENLPSKATLFVNPGTSNGVTDGYKFASGMSLGNVQS